MNSKGNSEVVIKNDDTLVLLNQEDSKALIAQSTSVDSWQLLPYTSPILPVHAALLYTGQVFFFCGSGNDASKSDTPFNSVVWDVNSGTFTNQPPPTDALGDAIDLFCAGQSFRSEGVLMIVGGTLQYDPFYGSSASFFFDPSTQQLTQQASMNGGRWYGTLLTLGGGRMFALSGLDGNGNLNIQPEIYSFFFGPGWKAFPPTTSPFPQYAHLFLLSTGQIFYSGVGMGGNNGVSPRLLTLPSLEPATDPIVETEVGGLQASDASNQAASVLLPPAQSQRVMVCGGGDASGTGTNRVNIVDFTVSNPTYTAAAALNYGRMHHNAVLLPDRTVFVCNGSQGEEDTTKGNLPAEIYDPATDTWTAVATPNVTDRVYHSVALLLPDGRVATAGGNPQRTVNELRLEIYNPAYVSQPRPVIDSAPAILSYGQTFTIQTSQAGNIKWVHLIKPMATTHTYDTEQRLVDLPIASSDSTSVTVTVPDNNNIAPVGWYMLFITDNNGVPSVSTWIQIPQ